MTRRERACIFGTFKKKKVILFTYNKVNLKSGFTEISITHRSNYYRNMFPIGLILK